MASKLFKLIGDSDRRREQSDYLFRLLVLVCGLFKDSVWEGDLGIFLKVVLKFQGFFYLNALIHSLARRGGKQHLCAISFSIILTVSEKSHVIR